MVSAAVKPEPITRRGMSGFGLVSGLRVRFEKGRVERGCRRGGGGTG